MTFASRSAKKRLNKVILFATAILLLSAAANAEDVKLFKRQATLGGKLNAAVLIVGWQRDSKAIEQLVDIVAQRAGDVFMRLDWQNPASDVARLNAHAGLGPVTVSDDTISAFEEAKRISKWTGGWFDVAAYGSGSYRNIKIDGGKRTVELKKAGMQVRFDGMVEGFLAEYMLRLISAANMRNALIKTGNVFRGMGSGPAGPWKIQVQDDAGTYAHHALNLSLNNTGIATISANEYRHQPLINPKNKSQIQPPCKGVTIVMKNAAQAQGVAKAVFTAGPERGYKLLGKMGKANGLIVDNNGKFIRTSGF